MSRDSWWMWLGKTAFPELVKHGMGAYIDHLGNQFQQGLVDADFLEEVACLLEEGAKTIRQMYGATGDSFMDAVRQKAKVRVEEVESEP